MLQMSNVTNDLKLVIDESVSAACNSLTKLSELSKVDNFYWHFIASCCNHAQPNLENLAKLKSYLFVISKLSTIFHKYCAVKRIEKSVIQKVPQEIDYVSNIDVKDYFKWIVDMQNVMVHWQLKFMDQDFNYEDIVIYSDNLQNIVVFAAAVYCNHLIYTAVEVEKFKTNYSKIYIELCLFLFRNSKANSW